MLELGTSVDDAVSAVDRSVADVNTWLNSSRLCLNSSKTLVLWLRNKNQVDKINIRTAAVLWSSVGIVDTARDLGMIIDSCLTMSEQVSALCSAAYFQQNVQNLKLSSQTEKAKKLNICNMFCAVRGTVILCTFCILSCVHFYY